MQYRRKQNLCYKYEERFGVGHQCKTGNLNCIGADKEEETDFEDIEGEQDEHTSRVGDTC